MRKIFWRQTLTCLIFALWQSHLCDLGNSGHFVFLGDLAKLAITVADIDSFYWNLVICMPFDAALLLWNFVKILHCLWKLWKCIQRFTFFSDSVECDRIQFRLLTKQRTGCYLKAKRRQTDQTAVELEFYIHQRTRVAMVDSPTGSTIIANCNLQTTAQFVGSPTKLSYSR